MGVDNSIQAISALSKAVEVTGNNLANVNTPEYKARHARLEDGPDGKGVRVSHLQQDGSPGPDISGMYGNAVRSAQGAVPPAEGSNVDVARETVDLIRTQHAFAANVAMVREWDRTLGLIVNLKA